MDPPFCDGGDMTQGWTVPIAGVRWGCGLVWVWSWYTMYLEIFRWKHVTPSFRFNPGPPIPGTTIRAKPGLPLKFLYACFFTAPVAFLETTLPKGKARRLDAAAGFGTRLNLLRPGFR